MRINLNPKAYIYPLPVLVIGTYDENNIPNAMTAAWGSVCDTNKISIVIDQRHKTMRNILLNKEFTVSIVDVNNMIKADFVGIVSGDKELDKVSKTKWSVKRSDIINAPIFLELPLVLECKLDSYNEDLEMAIATIVNVNASDEIITNGEVDLNKFNPICYDTGTHGYYNLGYRVGNAYLEGKKIK